MALADFLQALLRQPGGPQNALAQAASDQGSAGPNGSAAYQNALQAALQVQGAPQAAPQGVSPLQTGSVTPSPQSAPQAVSGPSSGSGLGGLLTGLENIFNPQAAARNQTASWLKRQGLDDGTATLVAGNKTLLNQYLASRMQGQDPMAGLKAEKLGLEVQNLKNPTTDDIKEYQFAKNNGGYQGSFQNWMLENKRAGATNISDIGNTKGETTYDQNLGKNLAEKTVSIMDAGMQAPNKIGTYQMMKSALANVYQGAGGDTVQNLRRVASSLGFDVKNVGDGDLVQSLSNQLALQMRNPSGGAGMPGAMSDSDREFLKATVPGLGRTPEGNAQLIDYMTRIEQRNMDVAKLAQTYMDQNGGRLDYKFFNQLADFSKANPLFPEKAQFETPSRMPKVGDAIDGYIFKGGNPADKNSWEKQ